MVRLFDNLTRQSDRILDGRDSWFPFLPVSSAALIRAVNKTISSLALPWFALSHLFPYGSIVFVCLSVCLLACRLTPSVQAHGFTFSVFFGRRTAWMFGNTPPWAMVTPANSLFSSSSFLMASCK